MWICFSVLTWFPWGRLEIGPGGRKRSFRPAQPRDGELLLHPTFPFNVSDSRRRRPVKCCNKFWTAAISLISWWKEAICQVRLIVASVSECVFWPCFRWSWIYNLVYREISNYEQPRLRMLYTLKYKLNGDRERAKKLRAYQGFYLKMAHLCRNLLFRSTALRRGREVYEKAKHVLRIQSGLFTRQAKWQCLQHQCVSKH